VISWGFKLILRVAKYRFSIELLEDCILPIYKGFTFRGAFGSVFRKVMCVTGKNNCNNCLLKEKCVYSYIFETPVPDDSAKMKLYTYAPHPFVLEPPMENKNEFSKSEKIQFDVVLFGKAIEYLSYFVFTFIKMGKIGLGIDRAKFKLVNVTNSDSGKEIFNSDDCKLKEHNPVKIDLDGNGNIHNEEIELEFSTPVRIKFKGHFQDNIEFHIIMRNLLRRISSICYFHCNKELKMDFKNFISQAEKINKISDDTHWIDFKRYSSRQKNL
jgi:hypothetical protein